MIDQSSIEKRHYPRKKRLANERYVEEIISGQMRKYELETVKIEVVG